MARSAPRSSRMVDSRGLRQVQHLAVSPMKLHLPADNAAAPMLNQPHDGQRRNRLARTGFTNDRQAFRRARRAERDCAPPRPCAPRWRSAPSTAVRREFRPTLHCSIRPPGRHVAQKRRAKRELRSARPTRALNIQTGKTRLSGPVQMAASASCPTRAKPLYMPSVLNGMETFPR